MERHLIGLLDTMRDVLPLLAFVRGDSFKSEHWAALFRLLGMDAFEPKPTQETLTLAHFLRADQALLTNADRVKDLVRGTHETRKKRTRPRRTLHSSHSLPSVGQSKHTHTTCA